MVSNGTNEITNQPLSCNWYGRDRLKRKDFEDVAGYAQDLINILTHALNETDCEQILILTIPPRIDSYERNRLTHHFNNYLEDNVNVSKIQFADMIKRNDLENELSIFGTKDGIHLCGYRAKACMTRNIEEACTNSLNVLYTQHSRSSNKYLCKKRNRDLLNSGERGLAIKRTNLEPMGEKSKSPCEKDNSVLLGSRLAQRKTPSHNGKPAGEEGSTIICKLNMLCDTIGQYLIKDEYSNYSKSVRVALKTLELLLKMFSRRQQAKNYIYELGKIRSCQSGFKFMCNLKAFYDGGNIQRKELNLLYSSIGQTSITQRYQYVKYIIPYIQID